MIVKNKLILNAISILFVVISIFLLIVSEETKTRIIAVFCLLLFGGGNIIYNIIESKKSGSLTRIIAGMIGCLILIVVCYYFLPFHHLFDGTRKYTPLLGWIIGITGILFFGFGFLKSIIILLKRKNKKE